MRDLLADAAKNGDDALASARKGARRALPKRFYAAATVAPVANGFAVLLDGRPIRTQGKRQVAVPAEALAERLAAEWAAQRETIDPATMPLTRLVNTAVESAGEAHDRLREDVAGYAGSDLVLYRAESPPELVARQAELWDAALASFSKRFDVVFSPTTGVVHRPQPTETLERVSAIVAPFGGLSLTALSSATSLTGSAVLALGAVHGLFGRDFAWDAAHVDEDFNISQWGEDAEAAARRAFRRADFDAAMDVVELVGPER